MTIVANREARWEAAMLAERSGDRTAYAAFLQEFAASARRALGARLLRLGLPAERAEDVVQEILIAVHTRRDRWERDRPLMPWLNAIARYKTIDAVRRMRRDIRGRVDLSDAEWGDLLGAGTAEPAPGPADIDGLIATLPDVQGAVVHSIAVEGMEQADAARHLGMSEGAVRVAFHRALKRLRTAAWQEDR